MKIKPGLKIGVGAFNGNPVRVVKRCNKRAKSWQKSGKRKNI